MFTANPDKPGQPLEAPTINRSIGKRRSNKKPDTEVRLLEGCPNEYSDGANRIVEIDGYCTLERLVFHVKFVGGGGWRWIDVAILIKLKPEHVWLNFMR